MVVRANRVKAQLSLCVSVTMFSSLVGFSDSAAAATPTCGGAVATIVSSARLINGTAGNDVIVVQGVSKHTINAGDGADLICASSGIDVINGGAGNDTIYAGAGNDSIYGGLGNDAVEAGLGNDIVFGNGGDDTINGQAGLDSLNGDAGADTIKGGAGNDKVIGGDAGDQLFGEAGNDSLLGGLGNDVLQGGSDRDVVNPGGGTNYCASDLRDTVIGTCSVDATNPEIANVSVVPSVSAGTTVTFIWTVNDNVSAGNSWVKIGGPSGWVTTWCGFGLEGMKISTNAQGAVFSAKCAIPLDAVNTQYTAFFDAVDVFGQSAKSSSATFQVTGGASDASAPIVSKLALSDSSLTYGQTLNVTWTAEDETSVKGVIAWVAYNGYGFANNEGRSYIDYGSYAINRISGDDMNGDYSQQIGLNPFAPKGEYTIWISALDTLGNKNFYQTNLTFSVN